VKSICLTEEMRQISAIRSSSRTSWTILSFYQLHQIPLKIQPYSALMLCLPWVGYAFSRWFSLLSDTGAFDSVISRLSHGALKSLTSMQEQKVILKQANRSSLVAPETCWANASRQKTNQTRPRPAPKKYPKGWILLSREH
jgi:hypothetical protein